MKAGRPTLRVSIIDIQLERLTPTPQMPRIGRMNLVRRIWSLRNHHLPRRSATEETLKKTSYLITWLLAPRNPTGCGFFKLVADKLADI
jgi:hypothetical protein